MHLRQEKAKAGKPTPKERKNSAYGEAKKIFEQKPLACMRIETRPPSRL